MICGNVEGKARLEDLDIPLDWDVLLLLQEVSEKFTPAGHVLKGEPTVGAAVLVHRKHTGLITEWGGTTYPWVDMQKEDLVVSSTYLPSMSRTSDEWDE